MRIVARTENLAVIKIAPGEQPLVILPKEPPWCLWDEETSVYDVIETVRVPLEWHCAWDGGQCWEWVSGEREGIKVISVPKRNREAERLGQKIQLQPVFSDGLGLIEKLKRAISGFCGSLWGAW